MRKLAVLASTVLMMGGLMLAQAPATGAGSDTNSAATSSKSSATSDKSFAMKAAQGGLAEVELGQLAQQNAESPDVKSFGQKMVDDHTKANDQLKQVAAQQNIALPTQPDAKDKAEKARLEKLKGASFDKAYMAYMVTDHKKDVAEFQKEANSGKNEALKNFAQQTLPTLQQHLQMAQQTDGKVKGSSAGNASASAH